MPPSDATSPASCRDPISPIPTAKPRYLARLRSEDPERLAAISRKGANSPARHARPRKTPGAPRNMTNKEWAAQLAQAKDIAGNAMEALDLADALPAHANPIAREAMLTLLQMLATDMTDRARLGVIKTLLEYNLAPPAAVLNQRITSAEDLIDALVPEGVLRGETIPSSPVAS